MSDEVFLLEKIRFLIEGMQAQHDVIKNQSEMIENIQATCRGLERLTKHLAIKNIRAISAQEDRITYLESKLSCTETELEYSIERLSRDAERLSRDARSWAENARCTRHY